MSEALPPCGLYRTTVRLGPIAAGRLVSFHNHGDEGPGLFLPSGRAGGLTRFAEEGVLLDAPWWASTLDPLPFEGLYRVREAFHCCDKRCALFEPELLVLLSFTDEAQPALSVPEWTDRGLDLAVQGRLIERARIAKLCPLRVAERPRHP